MLTKKSLHQTIGLALVVLLLTGCGGTPPSPTPIPPTATPTLPTATPIPATATPVPAEPVTEGLQPLDTAECSALAGAVEEALGIPATTGEAPFEDYISGQSGTGCRVAATGNGLDFEDIGVTIDALLATLQAQGWQEDMQYGGGGAGGWIAGYRRGDALCLFVFSSEPSDEGLCSDDEPMVACWDRLMPEQQIRNFTFDCVQGTSAGAHQPAVVALEDGTQCVFAGMGATLAFDGKRLNYTCGVVGEDQIGLLGDLQPADGGWMVEKAVIGHNEDGSFIRESETVIVFVVQQ